uniref:Large ribosomal subunit protein uL2 C-terminal domain-containing protein n=2 Tax=Canis lupus familiaris TaxID=9615 RepID=A0A8I3N9B2_CANLF
PSQFGHPYGAAAVRASGNYSTVISHNPETKKTLVKLPSGSKKVISSANRAVVGVVAGGGRIDKPILKAVPQVQGKEELLATCAGCGHESCGASFWRWQPPAHGQTLYYPQRCPCWPQSGSYCCPADWASPGNQDCAGEGELGLRGSIKCVLQTLYVLIHLGNINNSERENKGREKKCVGNIRKGDRT